MPTTLSQILPIDAYLGRRDINWEANRQDELSNINTLSGLLGLQRLAQARQQEKQLRDVLSQAGGDPGKAVQALLAAGTPQSLALAAQLRSAFQKPEGQPIGAGGLRLPSGEIIPPAARPGTIEPTKLERYMQLHDAMPDTDPRKSILANAIRKESETAKQISPTVIQEAPVTPVTIQDPNDPSSTIIIDGRTGKVLGKGPKLTDVGKAGLKRQIASQGVGDAIAQARNLLTGAAGEELPTQSGVGAGIDYLTSLVGVTPAGARSADRLRVVGGSLVSKVPRFEGPQSDKDLAYYKEVAGRIGDATLPIARRLAALDEVENIWGQFEQGKKYGYFQFQGTPANVPQPPVKTITKGGVPVSNW